MKTARKRLLFLALCLVLGIVSAKSQAIIYTYPLPSIYTNSACYTLTVNGTTVPVVNYTPVYDYAEFSMSNGTANIQVTAPGQTGITSYNISPEKLGLTGAISGNTLSFTITNSQYLIVSVNGLKPFSLCADSIETNVPPSSGTGIFNVLASPYNADNTGSTLTSTAIQSAINAASAYGSSHGQGIVYVPPGVYLCGNLQIKGNVGLYLQGGSVIRCTGNPANYASNNGYRGSFANVVPAGTVFLSSTNAANVKIYGRGTVDGNGTYMGLTNNFGDNLLIPLNCTNFTIDGVTFRDAAGWALVPSDSTNVLFSNLKIFDNVNDAQDDCVDVDDSQNVTVSDVVGIAGDDTLSTKSYSYPISNVLFEDCLLWSQAIACKVGWEVYTPQYGITYSNIVVYNCQNGVGLAENKGGTSGGGTVQNLTYEDIDVQNTTMGEIGNRAWGTFELQTTNGLATNVFVGNITVRQTSLNGTIGGANSNAIVDGITFSNIYMPGSSAPASNLFQMDIFNQQFYTNLSILPQQSPLPAVYLTAGDASGATSFNSAGNWSDGKAPNSATNYVDAAFVLRAPTKNNATFAGGSLSLYDSATLALKNDNSTTTIGTSAANGLFLDNSTADNVDAANDTLAGYITLLIDGGIFHMPGGTGHTFTVSAAIGGSGPLQIGASGDSGTIKLSGANTYTGGTTFGTSLAGSLTLQLADPGALGATSGALTFNSSNDIVDLDGTSQSIGNLSGSAGTILNNTASSTSTLTVGSGNTGGGIFLGNIVNGNGVVGLAKVGSGTITLGGTNTYTGGTTISGGVLDLTGSASISDSPVIVIGGGAIFDVSGLTSPFGLASGQILSNRTSSAIIAGNFNTGPGKISFTYTAGTPSFIVSNGTLTLSASTIFTVNNTGPALAAGSYLLISNDIAGAPGTVTGTLPAVTVTGSGIATGTTASLRIQNGLQLVVSSMTPSIPVLTSFGISGSTLSFMATNGPRGGNFVLLQSTNLALPISQWTPVLTNFFDGNGNLNLSTNILRLADPQEFYILQAF